MSVTISPAATAAEVPTTWDSFRVLLHHQRADCVRQRELALAEAATSIPDPVAVSRGASLLLTIGEIDAAVHAHPVGARGDPVQRSVDLVEGLQQADGAAEGHRIRHRGGRLGQGEPALPHAVRALVLEQNPERVPPRRGSRGGGGR